MLTSEFINLPLLLKKAGFEVHFPGKGDLKPLTEAELKEYKDFLKLAKRLSKQGKKVWIEISY